MLNRWLERLKTEYKKREDRRAIIFKLMVAVIIIKVLSSCLNHIMTGRRKKIVAQAVSIALIFIFVIGSMIKPDSASTALLTEERAVQKEAAHNVVENGNTSAHVELNKSKIQVEEAGAEEAGQKSSESQTEQPAGAGEAQTDKNQVVGNRGNAKKEKNQVVRQSDSEDGREYAPMALVQGLEVDYGEETGVEQEKQKVQRPVDTVFANPYVQSVSGHLGQRRREYSTTIERITGKPSALTGVDNSGSGETGTDSDIPVSGASIAAFSDSGASMAGSAVSGASVGDVSVVSGASVEDSVVSGSSIEGEPSAQDADPSEAELPELQLLDGNETVLSGRDYDIYCTNMTEVSILPQPELGVMQYHCLYGAEYEVIFAQLDEPKFTLSNDFYGSVLVSGRDEEDNEVAVAEKYYLIEDHAPDIDFSAGKTCTAPYTLWVDVRDGGQVVSGIQNLSCKVNGEEYSLLELETTEYTSLADSLSVPSKCRIPVVLEQEGTYEIEVAATDYAGNESVKKETVTVTKPDLVSVYMQKQFTIHIDPQQLQKREQIYTDDIMLANTSEFDVKVKIDKVTLFVNDEKVSGQKKDCKISLVAPDTGEKIKLSKGVNKDVYSFVIPSDEKNRQKSIHFVGDVAVGSDKMWKDSDLSMDIQMSFERAG